jgi:hypothetical protein
MTMILLPRSLLVTLVAAAACGCSKPKIKTTEGEVTIVGTRESDRFPLDCANPPSPGCDKAKPGYKVLVVNLEPVGEIEHQKLFDASKGVYVTASDQSRTERFAFSANFSPDQKGSKVELSIAFTPPENTHGFTLFWPDNPGIDLGL